MWNLGLFLKIDILSINANLKFKSNNLLHIGDACDYLPHTTFHFYPIDFQINTDFPSQFCIFSVKLPSFIQSCEPLMSYHHHHQ